MFLNNILHAETSRKHFENTPLLRQTLYKFQSQHKAQQALNYIHACIKENLCPSFLRISNTNKKQIGLKAAEIFRLRKRKLKYELKEKSQKLIELKIQLEILSQKINCKKTL